MNESEYVFEPHDVIYLQTGPEEGYEDWENFEYEGVTWCQDQINDGDTKYLLATPVRESAEALLAACEFFMKGLLNLVEIGALANKEYDAAAIKYVDEMHQLVTSVRLKTVKGEEENLENTLTDLNDKTIKAADTVSEKVDDR